eukprot:m.74568 g.74568  ORF g.74568 m.74568 type:complete len:284 (+) comp13097_c0_seq1:65-916(+)
MAIRGIVFSEFDSTKGPQIAYEVPVGFLPTGGFKVIEKFLIPKVQLCNRVISIVAMGFRILSYPVNISNPKYYRNHLLFNITFFLEPKIDPLPYESLLARFCSYIRTLEIESGLVVNKATKQSLPALLTKVMEEINMNSGCLVAADPANAVHLQVTRPPPTLPPVPPHMVPILLVDASTIKQAVDDIVLHEVLHHIDGRAFVKRIAHCVGMPLPLVQQCIACLLAANLAVLADVRGGLCHGPFAYLMRISGFEWYPPSPHIHIHTTQHTHPPSHSRPLDVSLF